MNTRAANRYAKALLELAFQSKMEEAIHTDMQNISQTIAGSKELQQVLNSPILNNADKKKAVDAIFNKNINPLTSKLFGLLEENKRFDLLQAVTQQFNVLYLDKKGIVKAVVTSAVALDEALQTKVMQKAQQLAGDKKIVLEQKIDETLIGGFILRVGDVQVDTSITNQLKKLKRELIEK